MQKISNCFIIIACLLLVVLCSCQSLLPKPEIKKTHSTFFPADLTTKALENAKNYDWAKTIHDKFISDARPWKEMSDNDLWNLVFSPNMKRAWATQNKGYCPSCKNELTMYQWKIHDPLEAPWKVSCPKCGDLYPKNDFGKYYRSGINEQGEFDHAIADQALLFNTDHPDPKDPKHKFGVDGGNGYAENGLTWNFIAYYTAKGQWYYNVLGGIEKLANAFTVTGDPVYARKAAIILDRVADFFPDYDYVTQGHTYSKRKSRGYVVPWYNASLDTKYLALAYDQIFDAIKTDKQLIDFLSGKAKAIKLSNPKTSFSDIQRNIEERILRDSINHRADKIKANYPWTEITVIVCEMVLGWPENRLDVEKELFPMLKKATAVDGTTGEKGGYSSICPSTLVSFLTLIARADSNLFDEIFKRYPLHKTYRFHLDTWVLNERFYAIPGDDGSFGKEETRYKGVRFRAGGMPTKHGGSYTNSCMPPPSYTFLWQLYKKTGDEDFLKVLYKANDNSAKGLPYDLLADEPETIQQKVADTIKKSGTRFNLKSVNKKQWHLAILRSGKEDQAKALTLDYDSCGGHGHYDGLDLGLYAYGLDLMPDFGYVPVQFGGWHSPEADWYAETAAHNTVTVDKHRQRGPRFGKNSEDIVYSGKTPIWAIGKKIKLIRASAPSVINDKQLQYERTVGLIDSSGDNFYVPDIFRVVGGKEHAKFFHSFYGDMTTQPSSSKNLNKPDYGRNFVSRNFKEILIEPKQNFTATWNINDRFNYLKPEAQIKLNYTDLSSDVDILTSEAWVAVTSIKGSETAWIPRLMIRRKSKEAPLQSTFVSIIEPYNKKSAIREIRRLSLETASGDLYPDSNVAIEISLLNGDKDLFLSADVENPLKQKPNLTDDKWLIQKDWKIKTDAELCHVRLGPDGALKQLSLCNGSYFSINDKEVPINKNDGFVEIHYPLNRKLGSLK